MSIITDKLKENLIQTKAFIKNNPNGLYPYNRKNILQMIDYAIKNWDKTDLRLYALKQLAEKEIEIKTKGLSNDRDSEKDEGYFDSIYETVLEDTEMDGISGWGDLKKWINKEKVKRVSKRKVRKEKRTERRTDRKKNGNHLFNTINRLNPATVAARNALRVLISLNIFGIASILNSQKAKSKGVYSKAANMYFNLGGIKSVWDKSIHTGATRKPFLSKKTQERLAKGQLKGLGIDPATDSLLAVAGGFILTILKWIKDAGLNKDEETETSAKSKDSTQNITSPNNNTTQDNDVLPQKKLDFNLTNNLENILKNKENINVKTLVPTKKQPKPQFIPQQNTSMPKEISEFNPYDPPTPYDAERKKNKTKLIVGTMGIVGVGTAFWYFNNNKKTKSRPKLSGVKLA